MISKQENIKSIKKILSCISIVLMLALSSIILLNNFRIENSFELSNTEKILKHLLVDHNINDERFIFFEININYANFTQKNPHQAVFKTMQEINLYILQNVLLDNLTPQKLSYAEIFVFIDEFKSFLFRPPKSLA